LRHSNAAIKLGCAPVIAKKSPSESVHVGALEGCAAHHREANFVVTATRTGVCPLLDRGSAEGNWRRESKKTGIAVMVRTGNDAMVASVPQAIGAWGQGSPHAKSRF